MVLDKKGAVAHPAPSECPSCKQIQNFSTPTPQAGQGVPAKDHVAICWECGAVNIYADDELRLRAATAEELAELQTDAEAWAAVLKAQNDSRRKRRRPGGLHPRRYPGRN